MENVGTFDIRPVDTPQRISYIGLNRCGTQAQAGKEAIMSHGRDKPGKEKRKPKKEKLAAPKVARDSEVLQHVQQHGQAPETRH